MNSIIEFIYGSGVFIRTLRNYNSARRTSSGADKLSSSVKFLLSTLHDSHPLDSFSFNRRGIHDIV